MERERDQPYREVRALWRGLRILEALTHLGWAKPSMLSAATDIDRSTTYRLVKTLEAMGYVTRRTEDGAVAMTRRVKWIASGVRDDDILLDTVGRHLKALVRAVEWPSDFARLLNGTVKIEESNHSLSHITFHRATIGQTRSLLGSALGQAILSVLTLSEVSSALNLERALKGLDNASLADVRAATRIAQKVRRAGYASSVGSVDPNVSAIAVPLRVGEMIGAINVVFFGKVMSPKEAANRFLGNLQRCADSIVEELSVRREW